MHRSMHSFCRADLFFHSLGNTSFSGTSDSTNFFHRFAEPSMSLSKFLNSSISERTFRSPREGLNQSWALLALGPPRLGVSPWSRVCGDGPVPQPGLEGSRSLAPPAQAGCQTCPLPDTAALGSQRHPSGAKAAW